MTRAIILDTETTGLKDSRPVEIAWVDIANQSNRFAQFFNPGVPIEYGAMATHHITNERAAKCPPHTEFKLPDGLQYLIGHNIDFDLNVIQTCGDMPPVKTICTLAISQYLYPEADSHKLTAMLYMLDLEYAIANAQKAHGAAADVEMTLHLFGLLLEKARSDGHVLKTLDDLWQFSEMTRTPTHLTFGKHKGLALADIPRDYVKWLLSTDDLNPYLRKALTQ